MARPPSPSLSLRTTAVNLPHVQSTGVRRRRSLLPASDQELANPQAQGACRNKAKLQQGRSTPHPLAVLAQTSREEAGGSKHLKFTGALRRGEMLPPQGAHSCPGTLQAEFFPTLLHSPSSRQQLQQLSLKMLDSSKLLLLLSLFYYFFLVHFSFELIINGVVPRLTKF